MYMTEKLNCGIGLKYGRIKISRGNWRGAIVLAFLYGAPIIDNLLGAQMQSTGEDGVIGKLYRTFFILALISLLATTKVPKKTFFRTLYFLLWILLLPILYTLFDSNAKGLFTDYAQVMKLAYPIILYTVCNLFIVRGYIKRKQIENVLKYYVFFYPLSIVIPYIMGVGYRSYASYDNGYLGFYGAGNELSIVLVCMYIISLNGFLNNKKKLYLIAAFLNAFSALLTSSKTGMIVLVISTIILAIHKKRAEEILQSALLLLLCVAGGFILFGSLIIEILQGNLQMLENKYNQMDTSFVTYLLSARNLKIIPNFIASIFENEKGLINLLFGQGYFRQVVLSHKTAYTAGSGLVEMDWFDIFFQHGLIVLIFALSFYGGTLRGKCSPKEWIYKFAAIVMLAFSTLAGHTLQSTLPSTTLIIMLVLLNAKESKGNSKLT